MYKIQPWAHQLKAIELARHRSHFALFFEQGCGKTPTMVNILRDKIAQNDGQILRTLILCPQIVIENWKREITAHSDIPERHIHPLRGSQFARLSEIDRGRLSPCLFITNYEAMNMKRLVEKLIAWKPQVVILDESHKCKDVTTNRTKQVLKIAEGAEYRYILSGTPIVNSAFDIFAQFLFLDGGTTFTKDYRKFRSIYFLDRNANRPKQNYFPDWVPKPGSLNSINLNIYKSGMRVVKSEAMDLPPFVRQRVDIDLSDEQRRVYKEMEKDFLFELNGAMVTADLAIKKALRLQQITTGYVKDDDDKIHIFKPNPRLSALEELLEQICSNHKVIVWAVFKQNYADIRRLCEKLKIQYVEVHGEVAPNRKQDAVDRFTSQPGVRVLIGHPASAGIGVNLVAASYSIFYSRGFSLENDEQAEARNYRGGSEKHEKITRIDIVARNTIDEVVLSALADKKDVSEAIVNHLKGTNVKRINNPE